MSTRTIFVKCTAADLHPRWWSMPDTRDHVAARRSVSLLLRITVGTRMRGIIQQPRSESKRMDHFLYCVCREECAGQRAKTTHEAAKSKTMQTRMRKYLPKWGNIIQIGHYALITRFVRLSSSCPGSSSAVGNSPEEEEGESQLDRVAIEVVTRRKEWMDGGSGSHYSYLCNLPYCVCKKKKAHSTAIKTISWFMFSNSILFQFQKFYNYK